MALLSASGLKPMTAALDGRARDQRFYGSWRCAYGSYLLCGIGMGAAS